MLRFVEPILLQLTFEVGNVQSGICKFFVAVQIRMLMLVTDERSRSFAPP